MVIACLTINWGLILLNKNKVVMQATKQLEFTPLLSESAKERLKKMELINKNNLLTNTSEHSNSPW